MAGSDARADDPSFARLSYEAADGFRCPSQGALRNSVASRLGYEPFRVDAPLALEARIVPEGAGLRAELRVRREGRSLATRVMRTSTTDCAELAGALTLAISLAIDPLSFARAAPPPPPPPPPPPLPSEVASLLDREREREAVDAAHVERLLRRFEVARSVAADGPAPRAAPRWASWRRDVLFLTAGVALGAGAHAVLAPRAAPVVVTRTVPVPQVIERVVQAPPAPPSNAATPPPPQAPVRDDAPRRGGASSHADSDSALAAERAALEIARTALARGQVGAALDSLARYERRYHAGVLGEERASLWVIALARAGRTTEARARAASFRRRWPESYLLPAIEAAVV